MLEPTATQSLRIAVFGLGYVGSVTASCLARAGHDVIGVDPDQHKVDLMSEGRSPIVEPGLNEIVAEARTAGRLGAVTSLDSLAERDLTIVCVGTPSKSNGDLDLHFAERVATDIGAALADSDSYHVVVFRSTMLPGSVQGRLVPLLEAASGRTVGETLGIAMCPEFLREGSSVSDFFDPPLTVIGADDDRAAGVVRRLFAFLDAPAEVVDVPSAEALKYACNAFHAIKVSFANEIGRLCQATGADSRQVMQLFCRDESLNLSAAYLRPGFSFGGSCLPKDLRALVHRARSLDIDLPLLASVLPSNEHHLRRAVDWVLETGIRTAAILGLSFKAGTDDLRESPSVALAEMLIGKGIELRIYDAHVNPERLFGANRFYVENRLPHLNRLLTPLPSPALSGAGAAIVATSEPAVVNALLGDPPPHVLDLSGRLGPDVEALPGYVGLAW
ncbi:MAG: nucleotide sugar dehydrogenase [Acidimicrobiia bacterium]|jgi:GDP-mannose 6-dehydrogenase|nr:nucleotide sugar dehydrogenase [Acidimicrobiia bacterium]